MDSADGRTALRLLVAALAFVVTQAVAAQAVVAAGSHRVIRVAVDGDYAPFSFRSEDDHLQGILVDQWQAWERKTGVRADLQWMDWSEAMRRMQAGEFDVIDCIVETPERTNSFDFTPPYATVGVSIFFRKDISGITDMASLKGFPVGVKAGDQHIKRLKESGVTTLISFSGYNEIVGAARQHRINVFVADEPATLYLLNKYGMSGDFRHSTIVRDSLRRAVRKGGADTLRLVSSGFAAIDPAALQAIDEKWFGRTIDGYGYGRYLAYAAYAAGAAILLLLGLFAWNRALRREILLRTAALAASEGRFRSIIEAIPTMVWSLGPDGNLDYINQRWLDYTGLSFEEAMTASMVTVHPDDVDRVLELWQRDMAAGKASENELRLRRADGEYHWFLIRTVPLRDDGGNITRWYGISTDIEDHKRAEEGLKVSSERLRALSARAQSAREEEGTRIAREIHDELGATLTSLRWELEGVKKAVADGDISRTGELEKKLAGTLKLTDTMITVVRRIAADLRPAVLDVLGLEEALEWQAQQFQERTGIDVRYESAGTGVEMDQACSTAVFRIFQEALTNVLRHAHASHVDVTVAEDTGSFVLMIGDNGRGITESERLDDLSIGLLGMRERAQLIGGEIDISGIEGEGTTVILRLPVR